MKGRSFPIPKPDLSPEDWVNAVQARRCVHLSPEQVESMKHVEIKDLPGAGRWFVCEACAEELDRRVAWGKSG